MNMNHAYSTSRCYYYNNEEGNARTSAAISLTTKNYVGPATELHSLYRQRPSTQPGRQTERLEECEGLWIERRPSNMIFLGRYDAASRQTRHISLRTTDASVARRLLYLCADSKNEDLRDVLARPRAVTVGDILDLYLTRGGKDIASHAQAKIASNHIRKHVGHRNCQYFTFENSIELSKILLSDGLSVGSTSRVLSVLRSALNEATRSKVIRSAPTIYEPRTAAHVENEPLKGDYLDVEQIAAFVDEAPNPHVLASMVWLLNTGARISAILEARTDQIDSLSGLVRMNPTGRLQTKKRRPVLRIPATLVPWLPASDDNAFVITLRGQRVKSIKTAIRGMRKRAGLPKTVNTYSIRHSLARWMERQKVPDKQISLVLGHIPVAVKRTTRRYTERPEAPEYLLEAAASIEAFVRAVASHTRKVDLLRPPTS